MTSKLALVKDYLQSLSAFATDPETFAAYLHPEAVQTEFPNLLNKMGQQSNVADLLRRSATGKAILAAQSYDITNHVESGDQLVVETTWHGTMAADAGPLKAGQKLKAYFCLVITFKDGKIFRQRNYDCFEPF